MAIHYVRKDGSGTHTTIQSAIASASSGDTINIGAGSFLENVEVFKPNISFVGAGKDQTIVRGISNNGYTKTVTYTSGSPVVSCADTSNMYVGQPVESSGAQLGLACYIVSINPNVSVTVSQNATASGSTTNNFIKRASEGTIQTRASGLSFEKMRIEGFDAHDANDKAALYFRNINTAWKSANGGGMSPSSNFAVSDCEIVADGEGAILLESVGTVGNGAIVGCKISGKTFSGANPVAGGVKQAVVIQPQNLPMDFSNNVVDVICGGMTTGGVYSGNQAVTIDANGSTVSGNKIRARAQDGSGNFISLSSLALRMRGNANTVSNNTNKCYGGLTNQGFLLTPSWTNMNGRSMTVGEIVWVSGNRFFKCIEQHTVVTSGGSANPPTGAGASKWQEITSAPDLAAQMLAKNYGYYVQNVNSNITATAPLVDPVQPTSADQLQVSFQKSSLLQHPSVSGTDFGSESNWYMVSCIYKKVGSSQRLVASFKDFSGISKKPKMKSGMGAGDQFELHKIIISKEDKTMVVLKRSQIDEASDSDFSLK